MNWQQWLALGIGVPSVLGLGLFLTWRARKK